MWSDLRYRLRALFRRRRMEQELDEELRFHQEREIELRAPAARHSSGLEQTKDACRDERGTGTIDRTRQDLRYAWRMFVRNPAFTITVIATLGLGIGGATTMFGVVDGVVLKPLPYPDAGRLLRIGRSFGGVRVSATSAADVAALSSRSTTFSRVAATRTESVDLTGDVTPERALAASVTASYFDVLGVAPATGQTFAAQDDRPPARPIVVVSENLSRRRFGGTTAIVGRVLIVNGQPHTIVAVMPRHFHGPEALEQQAVDLWLPLGRLQLSPDPDDASLGTIALLAPGADSAAATAELAAIGGSPTHFWTAPLHAETIRDSASGLWLLFGAVSLLLLLACTNIAHLFLVRATDRAREIAVRAAMGASRARIARQLVTETVCFSLAGGGLGALLAYGGIELVRAWAPADLPRISELHVDVRVLGFAFAVALLAGAAFGIMPALDARRSDFAGIMKGASASLSSSRAHGRKRSVLVVVQTALASMLVAGAGLLATSVVRLSTVDPGFNPSRVVWIDVALPERAYRGAEPKVAFFEQLLSGARTATGVESVSVIQGRPLGGGNAVTTVAPEEQLPAEGESAPRVPFHVVAPGYFAALKIPLLDGRDFVGDDRPTSPRVAIVTRAFADRFWPGSRAVGRRIRIGRIAADAPLVEVIGVAEDVRQYGLADPPVPIVYRALAQVPRGTATLVARHGDRPAARVIDDLRAAAWSLDSALTLDRAGTLDAELSRSIREPRFRAIALSAVGAIACVIACVGLYGSLAWLVRSRRRELGIRLALGADVADLRWIVLRRGLVLAGTGILPGLAAAAVAGQYLESLIFGVAPTDIPTFALAAAGMFGVAFLASALPARTAGSVRPIEVLKD
jgi:predicted permease